MEGLSRLRKSITATEAPVRRLTYHAVGRLSNRDFGDALRELMGEAGFSYRSLAEATRELDGRGLSHAYINMLANGHDKPSMRAMELIAPACGVQPEYFAHYRLMVAMRALDPDQVGLEQALENLNARLGAQRSNGAKGRIRPAPRVDPRPSG